MLLIRAADIAFRRKQGNHLPARIEKWKVFHVWARILFTDERKHRTQRENEIFPLVVGNSGLLNNPAIAE